MNASMAARITFKPEKAYEDELVTVYCALPEHGKCFKLLWRATGHSAIITVDSSGEKIVAIIYYTPDGGVVGERDAHYTGVLSNAFYNILPRLK